MKYSPRPKLNENGVSDPRKFILIDVNGEKVLFEANSATQRDAWVNAITFQFELAKGIAPTTVSPRVAHAASTINADAMSSGTLRSSGSGNGSNSNSNSAASTLRSRPSASFSSTPAATTSARNVVTVVDSDDDDDINNNNNNGGSTADDDALLLFPSVPSKAIDDNMFPSVPGSDDGASSLTGSSTIDSSLFPSVPVNSSGTIDLNLFPSVPDAPAVKPAPVARRPTLVAEVSDAPPTLRPDAFPSTASAATATTSSARSPRANSGGGGFLCRVCGLDTDSSEALRQHTRQAHNRDLTYDCLFPGCRSTYTDEANLMLHLAHVHPTFARDNGYIDDEPSPSPAVPVMTLGAPASPAAAAAPIDRSLAAVEMTLDVPDAKSSLYAAFLLGPDSGSDKEPSPVVPRALKSSGAFVGKTSADAMAAVAAEKARRERAAAAEAAAEKTRREHAAATEAAVEKARRERAAVAAALASAPSPAEFSANVAAAAAPAPRVAVTLTPAARATAPPTTPGESRRAAPITSGVIGGGDDDDIPDAPEDVPDTPSFDSSGNTTMLVNAVAAVQLKPVVVADDDEAGSTSPRASSSPFSAMALMNARKHMKAPPNTKGVSLEAPQAARAAHGTSPRLAPRAEGEKTPAMLESLLHLLLKTDESLNDATRAAAVANWMALFDGKWSTLQRLVDDYAGLVRVHALQPNTAYKKMAAWEKGLFRKLGDAEAAELRKQKMFFMESLELPEIEEHIAKHWALIEAKKKQAAEAERKAAQGVGMMGVLGQLKQRGDEQRARELAEAAAKLPTMEKAIDFDDDL